MGKRFPYVQEYRDNRGKLRRYFRRGTYRVPLPSEPGSPEFIAAYAAALAGTKSKKVSVGPKPKTGSLNALITAYYVSEQWRELKVSSQAPRRRILERLREKHGDKPVALLPKSWIKKQMADMADTPAQANRWLQLLRQLLDVAIDEELIETNPARLVKKFREGSGHEAWPEEEISKFEKRWPTGTKERLAFDLFLHTGQRIGDVAAMMRTHIRDGAIRVVQEKTGAELWVPIHPQLLASLAAVPTSGLALLQRQTGQPYTKGGLDNWFRRKREAAQVSLGLSAHGLRKAAGRRLAEAGATAHEIMAILGHRSLREVQRYTADADQKRNAKAAMNKVAGTHFEQKLSSGIK
ncbi:MAG: tyrosine-type recombinase/integrase [Amphiplicatus sp.]|nr:tyrosine-type recombinase/integrase [Amphiplicatus sp.]MCB9954845.1 tyrosine-type recombinase/integrase [Caulobacterales bacterium]HRX40026.1 tyrosine-type recombinase/integrase [Parvularculaceae bacterium]